MQNKLIVILGASGTKKTALSIDIAKRFNCEIINSDAFQVYKEINIGINKPKPYQLNCVKHHLIDNISIFDKWDVSIFQKEFEKIYQEIIQRNKVVILCGGSHLYVDSIVSGYNFTKYNLDNLIELLDKQKSNDDLYKYILDKDPIYAGKISINNRRRLLRTVALMQTENLTKTEINNRNIPKYKTLIIMTYKSRDQLYKYLDQRTEEMIKGGWSDEVKSLLIKYGDQISNLKALKALGYPEIINSILNKTPINKELIKQKIRKFAKRQITWCNNKFPNKIVFDYLNPDYDSLYKKIEDFLNE